MAWTTDEPSYQSSVSRNGFGYTPINEFGADHWMLDIDMDCSATEGGWFEVKAVVVSGENQEWERDVFQEQCVQTADVHGSDVIGGRDTPVRPPFQSRNHVGLCGKVNVFEFDSGSCHISMIDPGRLDTPKVQ